MKSSCKMPDLKMALLEAVRLGDAIEPDVAFHFDVCDDCQATVERLRRMASVWMAETDPADNDAAISMAAARFSARSSLRKKASWQGPLPFAFAGALAAAALLLTIRWIGSPGSAPVPTSSPVAAERVEPGRFFSRGSPDPNAGFDRSTRAALAIPHVEGPHGVTPLANGLRLELKEGESARVALANGQSSELHGPCAVEFWSSSTEVGGWRLSAAEAVASGLILADPEQTPPLPVVEPAAPTEMPVPSKRAPLDHAKASSPGDAPAADLPNADLPNADFPNDSPNETPRAPSARVERAWARATEAMRRDDFTAADNAFGELCHSPDAITRDKARLARAQLWIAHGRGADVRSVLVDLAANGANDLVRERAAEFLRRQNP